MVDEMIQKLAAKKLQSKQSKRIMLTWLLFSVLQVSKHFVSQAPPELIWELGMPASNAFKSDTASLRVASSILYPVLYLDDMLNVYNLQYFLYSVVVFLLPFSFFACDFQDKGRYSQDSHRSDEVLHKTASLFSSLVLWV